MTDLCVHGTGHQAFSSQHLNMQCVVGDKMKYVTHNPDMNISQMSCLKDKSYLIKSFNWQNILPKDLYITVCKGGNNQFLKL